MKKITLAIEGMTCAACSSSIEKYLSKKKGIESVSVNLVLANATINYDDGLLSIKDIETFISDIGFKSAGIFDIKKDTKEENNKKNIIIFGFVELLLFYFSHISMAFPRVSILNRSENPLLYCLIVFSLSLSFLFYARDILRVGYKNIIHKIFSMDSLVFLSTIVTFLYSIYITFATFFISHSHLSSLCIESIGMILYFVKLGRFLENKNKQKSKEALKELVTITPQFAYIKTKDGEMKVTIDEIKEGDILISHAGERVSCDGVVIAGESNVDEKFITGESLYKKKKSGDNVIAGSFLYDGYIEYRAIRIGKNSMISEITSTVIKASGAKMKLSRIADDFVSIFIPIVLLIAFLSFVANIIINKNFDKAIISFITIITVSCPCSLGLAAPLSIIIAEGLAYKRSILVKNPQSFESAARVRTIFFDKTGTLTKGDISIYEMFNFSQYSDMELLKIAASLENKSSHPLALAFRSSTLFETHDFSIIDSVGISASIQDDKYYMANNRIFDILDIKNEYKKNEDELKNSFCSAIYIIKSKTILGLFGLRDVEKDEAKSVVDSLENMKINVSMLTGDSESAADFISSRLGIKEIFSSKTPKEKYEIVTSKKSKDLLVAMCADGINDAPSLAGADVGISVFKSTDIATNTADVVLLSDKLMNIPYFFSLSRKVVRNIKENLFWAFSYNTIMILLASGIFGKLRIDPSLSAFFMVLSSLCVMLNSLRLKIAKI